jgi:sulfoquinovose isomerase
MATEGTTWRTPALNLTWLAGETDRLLSFADGSVHPAGGFAPLDDYGAPNLTKPVRT